MILQAKYLYKQKYDILGDIGEVSRHPSGVQPERSLLGQRQTSLCFYQQMQTKLRVNPILLSERRSPQSAQKCVLQHFHRGSQFLSGTKSKKLSPFTALIFDS